MARFHLITTAMCIGELSLLLENAFWLALHSLGHQNSRKWPLSRSTSFPTRLTLPGSWICSASCHQISKSLELEPNGNRPRFPAGRDFWASARLSHSNTAPITTED